MLRTLESLSMSLPWLHAVFLSIASLTSMRTTLAERIDLPGWKLIWQDDFDSLDESTWSVSGVPSEQRAKVKDGQLVIEPQSTHTQDSSRLGPIVSKSAQRFSRWEVRAKLPSAPGLVSAIRLLPEGPWPSFGEIDIATADSDSPTISHCDFHWGTHQPFSHDSRSIPQRTSVGGEVVSLPTDFHTYAVEWESDQLHFYVDDVFYTIFYSDEVGDFLPKLTEPMQLTFDVRPRSANVKDRNTSQQMLVDWVRVYERDESENRRRLLNGSIEETGGSLSAWHVFGNQIEGEPNIAPVNDQMRDGTWALKLSGQRDSDENYSGISQGIDIASGKTVRAKLAAFVPREKSQAGSANYAAMKIEFYSNPGDYFGGPAMVSFREIVIADDATHENEWKEHTLTAVAPTGSVEARLSIVFGQRARDGMAVYIDDIEFAELSD